MRTHVRRVCRGIVLGYCRLFLVLLACAAAAGAEPGLPLFRYVESKALSGSGAEGVVVEAGVSEVLRGAGAARVAVSLPVGDGAMEVFDLEAFSVVTPESRLVAFDGKTETPVSVDLQSFRGASQAGGARRAYLAVLSPDAVMGMVWGPGQETMFISPVAGEKGSGLHTVGAEPAFELDPASYCGVVDGAPFSPGLAGDSRKSGETLLAQVMVDVAHGVYLNTFGSNASEATEVVLGMVGAVSEVYLAEINVRIVASSLTVWTTPDSFNGSGSSSQLDVYAAYCKSNRSGVARDVAFLLDDAADVNGVAYINGLCSPDFGYGLVNLPTTNPTVRIITFAHELGHSFGSPHTHCYSPPLDCCFVEACSTCSSEVAQTGTIMSYCHVILGGSRVLQFGTTVSGVIRAGAEGASCVTVSPPLVGPPGEVSPADGASAPGSSVTLTWNSVGSAGGYQVQYATNASFTGAITSAVLTGTSYAITSLPGDGTTYYWRARAGNAAGWSGWSGGRSFVNGSSVTVPPAPVLSSPADGANVPGTSVPLVWSASVGATTYEVQHSLFASFASPWTSPQTSATTINWSSLPSTGGTYYWRVRAGNSAGWSDWSPGRHFVNGSSIPVPAVPGRVQPDEGSVVSGDTAVVEWTAVSGATKYENQVAFNSAFNPVWGQTPADWTPSHAQWSPMPNNGTTIYWRVRAGNASGWSGWSPTWSFVSGEALVIPGRVKPAEGEVVSGVNAVLEWTAVTGATKYENQIAFNNAFNPVWGQTPADWTLSHAQWSPMPDNGTTLYWRVRAGNASGWSAWSPAWSFKSGSAASCFSLSVSNGAASTAQNCTGGYSSGTVVTITANTAPSGQQFDRWTGDAVANATSSTTTITMNGNKSVTATYKPVSPTCFSLTVNNGSAQTSQNCSGGYTNGTNVTISANTAPSGQQFDRWTGDTVASATSSTTTINMNGNKSVTATYKPVSPTCFSLTVNNGSAQTAQNCSGGYTNGTSVTITANTAPSGQQFDRWAGDTVASATSSTTTIAMNGNKSVTATYKNNSTAQSVNLNRNVSYGNCWDHRDGYVTVPGVSRIRLVLQLNNVEDYVDYLYVNDVEAYSGSGQYTTDFYNGSTIYLDMYSDESITGSFQIVAAEYEGTRSGAEPILGGSLFAGGGDDCIDPCTPGSGCGGPTCVKLYESHQVAYEAKTDGSDVRLETEREIAGIHDPMLVSGKVWNIEPHAAFDAPVTVQVPLPDGLDGDDALVLYFVDDPEIMSWYLGQNVTGWLADAPREVLGEDGGRYLELVVTHGGRLQIVNNSILSRDATVLPLTEWLLTFALVGGLLAGLQRGWRRLRAVGAE